ncbi:MAG: hydantoinase B/oxoprolinase family protein [Bacillota bacterium]
MTEAYKLKVKPVDFAVLKSAVFTIAREMGLNMERTARAPIYFSAHDFCTSIITLDGELVSLAEYIPVLVGATPFAVKSVTKYFGGDINEGDVFLVNDPYTLDGGNQLADWCIVYPVFYKGAQVLWIANKAHQQDTGGGVPGGYNPNALDIYAEGLRIPPVRIFKNNEEIKDVVNLIMTNVRIPDMQHSDLLSMIGAARVAEKRLRALIDDYGKDLFELFLDDLLTYGEFLIREEISKIPNGTYRSEITGREGASPIVCEITIDGSEMTVDLSKSGPMSKEYINSPIANTYSAVYQAILQSIGKKLEIRCGGCYRPVKIKTKPGTIAHATFPVTHGNCTNYIAKQIIEAVWSALAQVIPEQVPAGWGSIPYWIFSGMDPRRGEGYGSPDFQACATGAGAVWGVDGWSTNGPVICSGTLWYPEIEVVEGLYPIFWERWEWAQDSGAPGKWRGGLGVHNEWVVDSGSEPVFLGYGADPFDYVPAPAIAGGKMPSPNRKELQFANGERAGNEDVRNAKFYILQNGDRAIDFSQGGCGVGDPLERDPELVGKDVRDEVVSLESAFNDYGVVIKPVNLEVDIQETKKLREKLKKERPA